MSSDIGVYGLAVMGQNLALNLASKGFIVSVGNRFDPGEEERMRQSDTCPLKVDRTIARATEESATEQLPLKVFGFRTMEEFTASLKSPRKVIILVPAGAPVDEVIGKLVECMAAGDIIIDGGNEWFPNSIRRYNTLHDRGIHFIGMGISGGEEGARMGASIMLGASCEAFAIVEPILSRAAAQLSGEESAIALIGPIGSGNYVKMVHNGIEYADMQLIAEIYNILKHVSGLTNEELSLVFREWNQGELESYLVEITSIIFSKKDDLTEDGSYIVDKIVDRSGMKGTGRWVVQDAAERNVAIPGIAAALESRNISACRDERVSNAKTLFGPIDTPMVERSQVVEDCRHALYAAKLLSYAQGFNLIKAASDSESWSIDLAQCAKIWQKGCVIRASLLQRIHAALKTNPEISNLATARDFSEDLAHQQQSLRRVVTLAVACGIPVPALSASIAYYDQIRASHLPANLIQAQRDFFGGHTFERIDRPVGSNFHYVWTNGHKDIGNLGERKSTGGARPANY